MYSLHSPIDCEPSLADWGLSRSWVTCYTEMHLCNGAMSYLESFEFSVCDATVLADRCWVQWRNANWPIAKETIGVIYASGERLAYRKLLVILIILYILYFYFILIFYFSLENRINFHMHWQWPAWKPHDQQILGYLSFV